MSTIISIVNNKGGVAKTTTVLNLSSALSKFDKKILMIDLDPQSSLSVYVGLNPVNLEKTTYDVITDKIDIKDVILKTNDKNIDIIPSSIELSAAEIEIISKFGREYILKNKLDEIKESYDYVIIDNSPSLGILTVNSMMASDFVIAPIDPTYLSLKGLDILTSTFNEIKKVNTNLIFMGVFVTMFDSRTSHHAEVLELLKTKYPVFDTIVKRSIRFSDACLATQSIIDYAGENFDGSKAYLKLAEEVLGYE